MSKYSVWLSLFIISSFIISSLISNLAWAHANNSLSLPAWQLPAGKTYFSQEKNIAQLPVPLRSEGYLELTADGLIWHTTAPIDSKLRISSAGVSQWQQQDYVAVAGSKFVGQLMLALLQGEQDFIQQHFLLQASSIQDSSLQAAADEADQADEEKCLNLVPLQAPLNQLFQQIIVCGEQQLQRMTLIEKNTSTTTIRLEMASAISL